MTIKWPEKKEVLQGTVHFRTDRERYINNQGWNACLLACRKAVEEEAKPVEDCLSCGCKKYCFEKCACGYPRGLDKQSPPLVALDKEYPRHEEVLKDIYKTQLGTQGNYERNHQKRLDIIMHTINKAYLCGHKEGKNLQKALPKLKEKYGAPSVLSVDELKKIIGKYSMCKNKYVDIEGAAFDIHAKLYGGTK